MEKALLQGNLKKSSKSNDSKDLYIEGIMSTPVIDLENEIIGRESYPDAIDAIRCRKSDDRPIPIFVEHRRKEWSLPVGTLEEAKDTENGLWFRAKIIGGPDGSYLDTVQRLIKANALYGCSIGGDATKSQMIYDSAKQQHIKKITKMDFRELSLTGMPVNQGSGFKLAKSLSGKDKIQKSEWQKEVSSLYKSLDNIIDKEVKSSTSGKVQKSISSLDGITKALEDTIEKGENVNDADILDKIKGALTDLADLLGIQDLVSPSAGKEMEGLEGMEEEGMAMEEPGEEMAGEEIEEEVPEEEIEEKSPEEEMEEGTEEEIPEEEETEEEIPEEEIEEEIPEEETEEEIPEEEEIEEEVPEEEEIEEEVPEEETEEEIEEEVPEEGMEEEIPEEEGAEELGMGETEEGEIEERAEGEVEEAGKEIMSDNVEDIEYKLDKIIQLLGKQKKGKEIVKKKATKEIKEKLNGGDTMVKKEKTNKVNKANKIVKDDKKTKIEKSSDIVGVRGEQATTPDGSDVITSQHPHEGNQVGNGQENFDIAVADSPNGSSADVSQKDGVKNEANTAGNDDIAIAENPDGASMNVSNHPYSVFKCSNPKCGQEFAKSEDYDPNFCAICGGDLDKYVYATEEQIKVLKDLEILQDMPAENTGSQVSEFVGEEGSYIQDKMKEVNDKSGNDIPEQSDNRNIQYGGKDVDGYGNDAHDFESKGGFKNFLRGADNAYSQKYTEGSQAYNGPKGQPDSKPYVGHVVKSQDTDEVELSNEQKTNLEKSLMGGLYKQTNAMLGKIENLEKSVNDIKDQPIKKSVQTSDDIKKAQLNHEKATDQVWATAFGFGKKEG